MKEFTLIEKKQLTSDVFELKYSSNESVDHEPGQFVTFILPEGIGGRSYSLLSQEGQEFALIVKRVQDGKKGSIFLCDCKIGEILKGVGPVGKFVLNPIQNAKLFAGTGTGIVPLYNQIVSTLESRNTSEICLLFGVRTKADLFYIEQLEDLKKSYKNFDFKIALSREKTDLYHNGYITDFVDGKCIETYGEAYLCGAPIVVDSMQEKLTSFGMKDENIYTEKY